MIGAGILPQDEDGISMLEILERDGGLAYANDFFECHATGLVAHIGGVGQIVGAIHSREELIEEGGFVARATGGIEDGFVGVFQGMKVLGHFDKCVFPRNGPIMGTACFLDHGVAQAPLLVEPVVGLLA